MIIKPIEGLCNRLRVILSYLQKHHELQVYWPIDDKICNSHFLSIFKPIENVKFLDYELPPGNIYDYSGFSANSLIDTYKLEYLKLIPKKEIIDKINSILALLGENFNACHIRRTDHSKLAIKHKLYTHDIFYINFIQNSPYKVYIATDNLQTQTQFKKLFGEKIITNNLFKGKLRNSTLADAFIDLVICSMAKEFKGSGYSSFTDTIQIFRDINYYQNVLQEEINDKNK